jgi:hypothetical protein
VVGASFGACCSMALVVVCSGRQLDVVTLHLDALSNEITMPGLETLLVVSLGLCWLHFTQ